jgi:DNA-binding NarL/FixJ family response regulator
MSALVLPSLPFSGGALIASPSGALREQVLQRLNGRCRPVHQANGGADALVQLEKGHWQVLYLDRRLRDLDVEELISTIQRRFPGIQVVMLDSDAPAGIADSPHAEIHGEARSDTKERAGVLAWHGSAGSQSATEAAADIFDPGPEALPKLCQE